jgi:general secretion pathway protein G
MALLIGSGEVAGCRVQKANILRGFTLVELLVVMAIIATLLTLAVPRYFGSLEKAREAVLQEDLASLRDALDKFFSDTGAYPTSLEDLVQRKYLRSIPVDPITESATTWVIVPPDDHRRGGVFNVKSGAEGQARNGSSYRDW